MRIVFLGFLFTASAHYFHQSGLNNSEFEPRSKSITLKSYIFSPYNCTYLGTWRQEKESMEENGRETAGENSNLFENLVRSGKENQLGDQ